MADSKKVHFSKLPIFKFFFLKISWIGPWVSRIDWCNGHWCSSTFWAYVGQPHSHIGRATSMPFASINSTNPRTNPWNFHKKFLRIGDFEKCTFFESAILNFFFQKKKFFFAFFPWKLVKVYWLARMGQNFEQVKRDNTFWPMPNILKGSVAESSWIAVILIGIEFIVSIQ